MFSKDYKLNKLKSFYYNTTVLDMEVGCPFNKVMDDTPESAFMRGIPCSELCGSFPELGDCGRGCPCHTLGSTGMALLQLETILKKEGVIR